MLESRGVIIWAMLSGSVFFTLFVLNGQQRPALLINRHFEGKPALDSNSSCADLVNGSTPTVRLGEVQAAPPPLRSPGVAPSRVSQGAHQSVAESSIVCWSGPALDLGGVPFEFHRSYNKSQQFGQGSISAGVPKDTIFIAGDGCRRCVAGHLCSFFIKFTSDDIYFPASDPLKDITVALSGPALSHVHTVSFPDHRNRGNSAFHVLYRTWDAGTYQAKVEAPCGRSIDGLSSPRQLASFQVEVVPPSAGDATSAPSPCEEGLYGRWVVSDWTKRNQSGNATSAPPRSTVRLPPPNTDGTYKMMKPPTLRPDLSFELYECTKGLIPPKEFVRRMLEKGVRVISFVGDSHQRALFNHLQQVVKGRLEGPDMLKTNQKWEVHDDEMKQSLVMNFYWMGGIYHSKEFGCLSTEGHAEQWPPYAEDSDIVILAAGSWTLARCNQSMRAYAFQLPKFMDWSVSLPHKPTTRFFWRTAPPWPSKHLGCTLGFRRDSSLAWANELARSLAPGYGIEYLNFWPIENPRAQDTCFKEVKRGMWRKDHHFSCAKYGGPNQRQMYGEVGDVMVRVFIDMLSNL